MNPASYVDSQIAVIKQSGISVSDAAWQAAMLCEGYPYIFGDRGEYCTSSRRQTVYNSHPDQTGLITKCQILNGKKGGCTGCQWYPDGKRVRSFDCRGFTYWILLQVFGWKLEGAGATSQWNNENNWAAKGSIDSMPEDKLVCLFYRKKDKPNKMAHTGFGFRGQTIECGNGVTRSRTVNKKWQYWALPRCISEGGDDPMPDRKPTLRRGDRGEYVTLAQTELIQKGYDCGSWGADGKFGEATENAVKRFQRDCGLTTDGVIGPETWEALEKIQPVTTLYTVQIPHLTEYKAEALLNQYPGSSMIKEEK